MSYEAKINKFTVRHRCLLCRRIDDIKIETRSLRKPRNVRGICEECSSQIQIEMDAIIVEAGILDETKYH